MSKQIEEVMWLMDALSKDCIAYGIAKMAGSESAREQIAGDVRKCRADVESKLRELLPVWLPIESAEKPAIGSNGFGERVLLLVDCGDGTLKSTKIGWWCNKWMMDTGGSVKEHGYRAIGWMPLPKAKE